MEDSGTRPHGSWLGQGQRVYGRWTIVFNCSLPWLRRSSMVACTVCRVRRRKCHDSRGQSHARELATIGLDGRSQDDESKTVQAGVARCTAIKLNVAPKPHPGSGSLRVISLQCIVCTPPGQMKADLRKLPRGGWECLQSNSPVSYFQLT
ncbi:hypothetical protein K504DRAFT_34256 [Pleomassaria siparia CBS 279.74]|uniref:Uncharacterized protein n=1 Tax=Pleomassaria siparia CBS 279.74 TaxID=1314801 RepID=A0A6G1KSB2_9PLEO|nr:hypothetical protein K504DRAFT_34256 [Pleomassaria siparia CBS 279.74]